MADLLTQRLIDQGKLVEAGWEGFKLAAVPASASEAQIKTMRETFFAGCHHMFESIMAMTEDGTEPTDKDMQRMTLISAELDAFMKDFEMKNLKPAGNA